MIETGTLLYHWPLRFGGRPSKWLITGYSKAWEVYTLRSMRSIRGKRAYRFYTRATMAAKLETGKLEYYF